MTTIRNILYLVALLWGALCFAIVRAHRRLMRRGWRYVAATALVLAFAGRADATLITLDFTLADPTNGTSQLAYGDLTLDAIGGVWTWTARGGLGISDGPGDPIGYEDDEAEHGEIALATFSQPVTLMSFDVGLLFPQEPRSPLPPSDEILWYRVEQNGVLLPPVFVGPGEPSLGILPIVLNLSGVTSLAWAGTGLIGGVIDGNRGNEASWRRLVYDDGRRSIPEPGRLALFGVAALLAARRARRRPCASSSGGGTTPA